MQQALRSVVDPLRAALSGEGDHRDDHRVLRSPTNREGRMDEIQVKHETDTVDSEANKFRLVAAVLMILSIGFGVLELMNIIHI
jgi:predicted ATP-dependent serine protease